MKRVLLTGILVFFMLSLPLQAVDPNPYSALAAEQRAVLQPGIDRYIADQIKGNWSDLWEIQDQTGALKAEIVFDAEAPDLDRQNFVLGMKKTMGIGYPHLKKFELQEVKIDKENFLVVGCGTAVRDNIHIHATAIFGARIVDGKPRFDIFAFVSNTCS